MGRRAKNKQGNPVPLAEVNGAAGGGRPSAKKLGKRKAAFDDEGGKELSLSKRPTKKVKESESGKGKGKDASGKKGANVKTTKSSVALGTKKRKDVVEQEEGGSSEGWEDVEDDDNFKTQTK